MVGRWQIVVHRRWIGIGSDGPLPARGRDRGCTYSHRLRAGLFCLRRWTYLYGRDEPLVRMSERG
jgi:hypothetical protein